MRIGIFGKAAPTGSLDAIVREAALVAEEGFATYWCSQVFGVDALIALAVVGREVAGVELGTGVVPTYSRHPTVMAQQALTVQAASGGRLCLGIGLSHRVVIEDMLGLSFAKPVGHMREYLDILIPLSKGERADVSGPTMAAHLDLDVKDTVPFPVVLAALGPQMLELAGRRADGTFTWCTGPSTLASYTIPTITAAAERAGRAEPRIIAALPVLVTADVAKAKERAARSLALYSQLPSYRAMLDREGADGPADVAIIGAHEEVSERIAALDAAGVTDFAAFQLGGSDDDQAATRAALKGLIATVA
jgi:5,10-methylenetetrahydromethanopterin reductase